ncbi:MAG: hypothetical protein GY821_11960 [Gammaproteobacteria bacterium]|nr:hypothetical protein [Gammaproteobacteria bacterium]MCP4475254.1 hypothetical protein [Gammaproteobacteria bacterium]
MSVFKQAITKIYSKSILKCRHSPDTKAASRSHRRLRLFAVLIMLAIALIGVFATYFARHLTFHYWRYTTLIFALINIALSFHAATEHRRFIMIWHEILHWFMLLLTIWMVAFFLHLGVISDITAGLITLTLLSLTTLLAGVHFDSVLILIGGILLLFDLVAGTLVKLAPVIMVTVVIVTLILLFLRYYRQGKKQPNESFQAPTENKVNKSSNNG